jgi:NhaA family Na+:H+ antiporter
MDSLPRRIVAPARRVRSFLRELLTSGAGGGLVLMASAALALIVANSTAGPAYFHALHAKAGPLSVEEWINDGLMVVFFLLVGLEIKREMLVGELSTWRRRALPGLAALGGMVAPALVYVLACRGQAAYLKGWAIPAATDIAFALGVLALLGKRVPASLKIFLAALAIIDDLGAVVVIAIFYSTGLSAPMLGGAALCLAALAALNMRRVKSLWPYLLIGLPLWVFVLKSGVHATIAGVLLAACIPLDRERHENSPLHVLEHALSPWVAYAIVPVFGFANAGVSLAGVTPASFLHPVTLGVAAGLFVGKQIGVFAAVRAAVALKWAARPLGARWPQVYGVSLICGVGFTMSLFIGMLAFPASENLMNETKLGVLVGSLLSALAGAALLGMTSRRRRGLVS